MIKRHLHSDLWLVDGLRSMFVVLDLAKGLLGLDYLGLALSVLRRRLKMESMDL